MKTFSLKNAPKGNPTVLTNEQLKQIKAGNNTPTSHDLVTGIGNYSDGEEPPK